MRNLSIKWSLTAALALLVVMIALASGLGFFASQSSNRALVELNSVNVRLANLANRTQVNALRAQTFLDRSASFSTQGNPERGAESLARAGEALARSRARFDEFQAYPVSDQDELAGHRDAIVAAFEAYIVEGMVPLLDAAPFQIQRSQESLSALGAALDEAMSGFITYSQARSARLLDDASTLTERLGIVALALLIVSLLAAAALRLGMMRSVVKPLERALEHFAAIADGDLTQRIEDRGRNEIGRLFAGLEAMQARLTTLVGSLRASSDSVFTGAEEISSGSQDLSTRTEEQASALQQTATSMEEMATTVRNNADIAEQADALSVAAARSAQQGGAEVERTVTRMRDIAESAHRVNDIIGVIDAIAFQTNILALNASVEAARAGEQGRGFAVVAGEVRALATRSADSAREIRVLIEQTTASIHDGARQAEHCGITMAESVEAIEKVTALVGEISTATREQTSGIEQINVALNEMDSVTQQNSALVQQTSAAAGSLEHQASELADLIATFKVGTQAAQPATPALDPPAAARLAIA
ncbi:methyl-accepting chemotaxis protein [Vreelandella malpeensis]|uniref:Tar ligand binding domain-containing protein n=1 Tax=Vreelandella malpeensis TaxID=1172368 RepID=A0ABS8DRI3_9GAMM|nr:methyl-accepting chemotaxis protein [Halomonas malpeensis]MCB8888705.1 Tar ligand binding domain-containing protein [Halomonas malpeensis]